MKNQCCLLIIIIIVGCCWLPFAAHGLDVPRLQGRVNDYAGMISPSAKSKLEEGLRAFEQSDSTQIVILTIPSLEGEDLEKFGIKVGDAWKIGQKGKDNGAILIVSKQERRIRIEAGRGLEGKLTDLMSGRIIDGVIRPRFKEGDIDGGFIAGVSSMIDATRGEFKAEQRPSQQNRGRSSSFLTFFLFFGIFTLMIGSFSRILGGIVGAIGLPALVSLSALSVGLSLIILLAAVGFGGGFFLPRLFSSGGSRRGGGFFSGSGTATLATNIFFNSSSPEPPRPMTTPGRVT